MMRGVTRQLASHFGRDLLRPQLANCRRAWGWPRALRKAAIQGEASLGPWTLSRWSTMQKLPEKLLKAPSLLLPHTSPLGPTFTANIPDSVILKMLAERLDQQDCVQKGWVLHGFPRDLDQAQRLDGLGYAPNRVFFLNVPLDSIMERLTLRRIDPVTGERYHLMYKPPPTMEIQARLLQHPKDSEERVKLKVDLYYRNSAELGHFYGAAITVNGDQDPYTVFEYIESGIINPLPKKGL